MRRLPTALTAALLPLTLAACIANPAPEIATPAPELPPAFFYQPDSAAGAELAALMPQGDPAWRALSEAAIADGPRLAARLLPPSSPMSASTTSAPSFESRRAVAAPMPRLAPVTTTRCEGDVLMASPLWPSA